MIAQPVKNYRKPQYPDKIEFEAQPELLHKNIPPAWKGIAAMSALVPLFLSACQSSPTDYKKASLVAPIFEHGSGQASIGCVMVTPPVFLSEEEAISIIKEELDRVGFDTSNKNMTFKGILVERKVFSPELLKSERKDWSTPKKPDVTEWVPLTANFIDKKRKVSITYVSFKELESYADKMEQEWSVEEYDFKEAAKKIVNARRASKPDANMRVVAFYNPVNALPRYQDLKTPQEQDKCSKGQAFLKKLSGEQKLGISKRLLRAQVKDFVDWLKVQGAI